MKFSFLGRKKRTRRKENIQIHFLGVLAHFRNNVSNSKPIVPLKLQKACDYPRVTKIVPLLLKVFQLHGNFYPHPWFAGVHRPFLNVAYLLAHNRKINEC